MVFPRLCFLSALLPLAGCGSGDFHPPRRVPPPRHAATTVTPPTHGVPTTTPTTSPATLPAPANTADAFVERLRQCAPDESRVRQERDLFASEARTLRGAYLVPPRNGAPTTPDPNPLIDLTRRYDVSAVKIGIVRLSPPRDRGDRVQVGVVGTEPLMLIKATGQVVVEDPGSPATAHYVCATDPGRFLDALSAVACFYSRVLQDRALDDDQQTRRSRVALFTAMAGGDPTRPFYDMLLGVD
jgi:hypothetical protein